MTTTPWFYESTDPGERRQDQIGGKPLFRVDFSRSALCLLLDVEEAEALIRWLNHLGSDSAYEAAAEAQRAMAVTRYDIDIEQMQATLDRVRREREEFIDPKEESE